MDSNQVTDHIIELREMVATQIAVQRGTNEKIDRVLFTCREHQDILNEHTRSIERIKTSLKYIGIATGLLLSIATGLKIVGLV